MVAMPASVKMRRQYTESVSPRQRPRWALWGPPVIYAFFIFHFSSESNPLPVLTSLVWDKALHVTEYGGFALLLCRAFRGEGLRWWWSVLLAAMVASVYGATDEWHQLFVPQRTSDVADWLADVVGAAAGSCLYRLIGGVITW
jgi:VanZ family protein